MTRAEAKTFLVTLGIAEPTEEQVTNYLNQINTETKTANDRANRYKADADKVAELQAKIDDAEREKLSDIEKSQKDLEKANEQYAKLQREMERMKQMNTLASMGIVGENAESLIGEDGSINFETLGKIISERETASADAKVKEIANNSTNPNGGKGGSGKDDDEKPADVAFAENITFATLSKDAQSARDYYK